MKSATCNTIFLNNKNEKKWNCTPAKSLIFVPAQIKSFRSEKSPGKSNYGRETQTPRVFVLNFPDIHNNIEPDVYNIAHGDNTRIRHSHT